MKIFLDANVLVSVINKEYPVFTYSSRIISLIENKKFKVYTSPICLAIAFYFAEKKSGSERARDKISLLAAKINIADVGKKAVAMIAQNKAVKDYEDGLEYYAALNAGCQCIITEDGNDFYFSRIPVYTSEQFMQQKLM